MGVVWIRVSLVPSLSNDLEPSSLGSVQSTEPRHEKKTLCHSNSKGMSFLGPFTCDTGVQGEPDLEGTPRTIVLRSPGTRKRISNLGGRRPCLLSDPFPFLRLPKRPYDMKRHIHNGKDKFLTEYRTHFTYDICDSWSREPKQTGEKKKHRINLKRTEIWPWPIDTSSGRTRWLTGPTELVQSSKETTSERGPRQPTPEDTPQ